VAEYYGRLLSWLVNGEFTDEFGKLHTGGPKYNLTHWEVRWKTAVVGGEQLF